MVFLTPEAPLQLLPLHPAPQKLLLWPEPVPAGERGEPLGKSGLALGLEKPGGQPGEIMGSHRWEIPHKAGSRIYQDGPTFLAF